MHKSNKSCLANHVGEGAALSVSPAGVLFIAAILMTLSACGGGSSGGSTQSAMLSGNWQFTLTNTADLTTGSGLQGGFLLQNNGSISGQLVYSNTLQGSQVPCNGGSASITGKLSGQTITLTATAGTQIFVLTGQSSSDGSTFSGTYTATPGPVVPDTSTPCGAGTTTGAPLTWTASSVPSLTGSVTGSFHSTTGNTYGNGVFPVTGSLRQGQNIGASSATVTGTLSFIDPTTLLSDYPCIDTASVNGEISGNNVILQIIAVTGSNIGQIGGTPGSGLNTVAFKSAAPNGYILQSALSPAYAVNSSACPGNSLANPGDAGSLCLALNSTTACQQPITLSPAALIFPSQLLGSNSASQTVTLTNSDTSGATLDPLTIEFQVSSIDPSFLGYSAFNQLPNYTASDNCVADGETLSANVAGSAFSLASSTTCTVTVSFSPQQSCAWLASPSSCPASLPAKIIVQSPVSADNDKRFAVPVTGTGLSFVQPSTPELDFSAEAVGEASLSQNLAFTNGSAFPVQILAASPCLNPPGTGFFTFPNDPLSYGSPVAGLLVAVNGSSFSNQISPSSSQTSVTYNCDLDPTSRQPNFQISADTCTGALLLSQEACSLQIAYVPQPTTNLASGLDFFLQLNTVQCWPAGTVLSASNPCEIDSGRFPVELRANPPSPLRLLPSAGLNFGNVTAGKSSVSQIITVLNDSSVPNAPTVDFIGKVVVNGNYSESDDCPFSLAPGSSCFLTVTFKPSTVGFHAGTLTINYNQVNSSGMISPGTPQLVYLRGSGQ